MANTHNTLGSLFTDIANAIRTKTKKTNSIIADNFPEEINSIVLGEGDAQPSDVKEGKTFTNDSGVQQTGTFAAETKSVTSNGTVTPSTGKYLSSVEVNVSLANIGSNILNTGGNGNDVSGTGSTSGKCFIVGIGLGLKCNAYGFTYGVSCNGSTLYSNYGQFSNYWNDYHGGGVIGFHTCYFSSGSAWATSHIYYNTWGYDILKMWKIPLE